MKTQLLSQPRQRGNVLLASLIISAIMGVTLASYLIMTQAQYRSVVRSQVWNASMALTEAGVEDGLAMINKYNGSFDTLHQWTNSVSSENWSALGNNVYHTRRYVSTDNWGTNYYDAYITNLNNSPVVTAVGVATWKQTYSSASPLAYYFATAGANTPSTSSRVAKRSVSVQTKTDPLFAVAMAAVSTIDMNGNGIVTDSFDSADPNHSINGLYPFGQTSMVKSNGDICTLATIIDSISVGNANINGKAKTGPNGTVEVGPSGYVTGGVDDDFNVKFPTVTMPSGNWLPGPYPSVTIDGTTYTKAILSDGDYLLSGLNNAKLYIGSNVTCRIKITDSVSLTGSHDEIRIDNGASVKIYMQGSSFKVAGNGIVNDNGNASSLYYYGLPSNTSIDFGGNGDFVGAIYAPQANFSLGGGGTGSIDFIGGSVTKSVKMNGHYNFHYDENLRRVGPGRGYIPVAWAETASN
jgi:type II secretory pathway pseudopilin PulG